VFVVAAFGVARLVERSEHLLAELGGFPDDGDEEVGCRIGVARQRDEMTHVEQVLEHEADVRERGFVRRHGPNVEGIRGMRAGRNGVAPLHRTPSGASPSFDDSVRWRKLQA
jgi:hypothetical protein